MKLLTVSLSWALLSCLTAAQTFQEKCASFAPQDSISNSTLTAREYVTANTNLTIFNNSVSCNRPWFVVPVDLCRVALRIPTSNRSSIVMEMWLPEEWNDRVLAIGNGGIDGCIYYENLALGAQFGFASVASNNGHNGTGGQEYLNNPDIIIDFSYRALHTSIEQLKRLATTFYEATYKNSYFLGCSLGGRQGIAAADRYPEDFDGIIAGAPGVDFNNLVAWRASFYSITGKNSSEGFINAAKWALIHQEVLNQCDETDGVEDGIIEDPSLCSFRPEAMICTEGANVTECLTGAQAEVVNRIFSPLYGSEGNLLYPAMNPGSELLSRNGLYAGLPWQISQDFYRYILLNDSTWDSFEFNTTYASLADEINPANLRTWPETLQPFADAGGKLITYHGGQDQQISSFQSVRFYNHLARGMSASSSDMDDFYRLFRISGLNHCFGGPGAWGFSQWGNASAFGVPGSATTFDPKINVLAALVDWVENGNAPENITGTKFVNDNPAQGVALQRTHCRYPYKNVYVSGNATLPSSWRCE